MNASIVVDKGREFRALCPVDTPKILQFYLGMNFQQRRARFGGAVSDDSIRHFCRQMDWHKTIVVGRERGYCLEAVIEIHSLNANWEIAEIAVANIMPAGGSRINAALLQIAAFAAGQRGCSMLKILDCSDRAELVPILLCMGDVLEEEDWISVEIQDYAFPAWFPSDNSNCNHV